MKFNKIMTMKYGSHLYGTNTPESDQDFKGIYLPSIDDILLKREQSHYSENTSNYKQKNNKDDIDMTHFSLSYFIDLACKGESVAIDMLHAPENMLTYSNPEYKYIWDFLVKNRSKFYTYKMKSYLGYIKNQAYKYSEKGNKLEFLEKLQKSVAKGIKDLKLKVDPQNPKKFKVKLLEKYLLIEPNYSSFETVENESTGVQHFYQILNRKVEMQAPYMQLVLLINTLIKNYGERAKLAKDNKGVDWKAIHHALRCAYQLKAIYKDGVFEHPLPEKNFLKEVKLGLHPYVQIIQLLDQLCNDIQELSKIAKKNGLREKVDRKFFDDFLLDVYHKEINKNLNINNIDLSYN